MRTKNNSKQHKHPITSSKPLSIILQLLITFLLLGLILISFYNIQPYWLRWVFFGTALLLITIQGIRLKCPLLFVDRIFAKHPSKQLVLALYIFTICFDFALCLFPGKSLRMTFTNFISFKMISEEVDDEVKIVFDTIQYKPNAEEIAFVEKPAIYKQRSDYLKYVIIYLLGLVVFNGLLIATITTFMTTRAKRYNMGTNTYGNIKQHVVIVGFNPLCVPIIRNVCNRNKNGLPPMFLILSSQNPEGIQRVIQTQLPSLEEHVVVYSGDMNSMTQLRRLNLSYAKEAFILGEEKEPGRDSKNLECAKLIKEIRNTPNAGETLPVNVQFDKPASYSTIKRITIPEDYYKNDVKQEILYIRPFNFYENWARLLWGTFCLDTYNPLDRNMMTDEDNNHVHLVIAGFNEMGTALLLEALRVCHYPNFNEETGANKTQITVVDPKMKDLLPRFLSQYPYLKQIVDVEVEFKNCRIEDSEIRAQLDQLARCPDTLLTVAICFYDADTSFSTALTLPDSLYYTIENGTITSNINTEILVRQEIRSGLANLLEQENGKFFNVKIFGTLDDGVNDELLNDKMAIIIAAHYHFKYDLGSSKNFFELMESNRDATWREALKNWISLNEDKRFANRYQTEIYHAYQRYQSVFKRHPEILYQTEHYRWCAERSITGYRDLHELNLKSEKYQIHKCIVPYQDLSDLEKGKDKDVLNIMEKVIKLAKQI